MAVAKNSWELLGVHCSRRLGWLEAGGWGGWRLGWSELLVPELEGTHLITQVAGASACLALPSRPHHGPEEGTNLCSSAFVSL